MPTLAEKFKAKFDSQEDVTPTSVLTAAPKEPSLMEKFKARMAEEGKVNLAAQKYGSISNPPTTGEAVADVVGAIKQDVQSSPFEIIGSVGGGLIGGTLGSAGGPPGTFGGATAGGVGGGTLGRRADIALGLKEPESVLESLGKVTGDEAEAIVFSKLASPAAAKLLQGAKDLGRSLGIVKPQSKAYSDMLVKEFDVDPSSLTPERTIIDASENLLNERLLAFEEVGGGAGTASTRELLRNIISSQKNDNRMSGFVKRQRRIAQQVADRLGGGPVLSKEGLTKVARDNLKAVSEDYGNLLNGNPVLGIKGLEQEVANLREKISINVRVDEVDALNQTLQTRVRQAVGNGPATRLQAAINNAFTDEVGNLKEVVTAADLQALDADIKQIIGKFKETGTQSEVAGVYASAIKPLLKQMEARAAGLGAGEGIISKEAGEYLSKLDMYNRAQSIKKIVDRQERLLKEGDIEKVFSSREEFADYMGSLFSASQAAPHLAPMFERLADETRNYFKSKLIVGELFTQAKTRPFKEISSDKALRLIDKYGEDTITAVAGPEYLRLLKDSAIVGEAMKKMQSAVPALTAQNVNEDVTREAWRTALGSVFSRINLISGLMDKSLRTVFFADLSDEKFLKLMSGKEGQSLIELSIDNPLFSEKGYNTYKQLFKLLEQSRDESEMLTFNEYKANIYDFIDSTIDNTKEFMNTTPQESGQEAGEGKLNEPTSETDDIIGGIIRGLDSPKALSPSNGADLDLIIREEGTRLKAYKDSRGFLTIGTGFNMDQEGAREIWKDAGVSTDFVAARKGAQISEEDAQKLLNVKLEKSRQVASKLVSNYNDLSPNRQAVLASMVFQLGPTGAKSFKNTLKAIEAGDFKRAANGMLNSLWAKQTPNRVKRAAEMLRQDISLKEAEDLLVDSGVIDEKNRVV